MTEIEPQGGAGTTPAPLDDTDADETTRLTAAWLLSFRSPNTQKAYRRDLQTWLAWCGRHQLDPLQARRGHVDAYARQLEHDGAAASTVARKMSAVSSWYTYLAAEQVIDRNPARDTGRPPVDRDRSLTPGLSDQEARRLLDRADADSPRSSALVRLLLFAGLRVGSVLNANHGDLGHDSGHRVLTLTTKGGQRRLVPLAPPVVAALDTYLASRPAPGEQDPLFTSRHGRRLDEPYVWRLVRRLARRAGVPQADRMSPHSLRHTFATSALDAGVPLRDVQDAMGHADPRTTRRYDRSRHNLDRHATYAVASRLSDREGE